MFVVEKHLEEWTVSGVQTCNFLTSRIFSPTNSFTRFEIKIGFVLVNNGINNYVEGPNIAGVHFLLIVLLNSY
jgi:hypothetical protein